MDPNRDRIPADLVSVAERLRSEREIPTALELDQLKLRAKRQAASAATSHPGKGTPLKSRVVLTFAIVLGLMMSTTGAGLAISGSSGQGNAAQAQYGEEDNDSINPPGEGTKGVAESPQTEATEQAAVVSDNGDSLPFTGFFTIPLIVGGVALLASGAVLRRRTRE